MPPAGRLTGEDKFTLRQFALCQIVLRSLLLRHGFSIGKIGPAAMLEVLYEDNHLLAVNKPAGLPTMGAVGKPCVLAVAKEYIRQKYNKSGNVYLGTVSRLDAPVTGVLLFARTSKAAARVAKQFRERYVDKTYWAIVEGEANTAETACVDWLRKDERHRKMHICRENAPDAQEARLSYRALHTFNDMSMLEIRLETGRKHQIRLQLASRGHAVIGDRKYGSSHKFPAGIALHARRLEVQHPTLKQEIELIAPLPKSWRTVISEEMEHRLAISHTRD